MNIPSFQMVTDVISLCEKNENVTLIAMSPQKKVPQPWTWRNTNQVSFLFSLVNSSFPPHSSSQPHRKLASHSSPTRVPSLLTHLTTVRVLLVTSHLATLETTKTNCSYATTHDADRSLPVCSVSFIPLKRQAALWRSSHPHTTLQQSSDAQSGGELSDLHNYRRTEADSDGVTKMEADETHLFDLVIFEFSEVIG